MEKRSIREAVHQVAYDRVMIKVFEGMNSFYAIASVAGIALVVEGYTNHLEAVSAMRLKIDGFHEGLRQSFRVFQMLDQQQLDAI